MLTSMFSIVFRVHCRECHDVAEGEGDRESAKATAELYGWKLYSRHAVCPYCQQLEADKREAKARGEEI
jgi:hypothetical protein